MCVKYSSTYISFLLQYLGDKNLMEEQSLFDIWKSMRPSPNDKQKSLNKTNRCKTAQISNIVEQFTNTTLTDGMMLVSIS